MSTLDELVAIEAIKQLKYKYFRCLDSKRWSELAECFVPDATAAYDGGKYAFSGRDAILAFLETALGPATMITLHQGHHPEITLTSPTTATGIWYLEDEVIDARRNTGLRGAAFYRDEYVKVGGAWKLVSTGYERTFEEVWNRGDVPSLKLTSIKS
jgi:bile-acid 7alpha-dehydratase